MIYLKYNNNIIRSIAVIGTINLDYRSLYLHFECATLIYRNDVIGEMERDFNESLSISAEYTLDDYYKINLLNRIIARFYRMFGPLM